MPPKRARVEQGVQTNRTMQDLDGMKDELDRDNVQDSENSDGSEEDMGKETTDAMV